MNTTDVRTLQIFILMMSSLSCMMSQSSSCPAHQTLQLPFIERTVIITITSIFEAR